MPYNVQMKFTGASADMTGATGKLQSVIVCMWYTAVCHGYATRFAECRILWTTACGRVHVHSMQIGVGAILQAQECLRGWAQSFPLGVIIPNSQRS